WFKVVKIFILLGFLGGYFWLFGLIKAAIFLGTFLLLMLVVHFTYRIKTKKYTQSWLDFTVPKDADAGSPKRIGKFYYPAILINAIIALVVSQLLG
ncbi:MAG: hypothetical protein AB1531_04375, partial [Chloroflexota bacterium]